MKIILMLAMLAASVSGLAQSADTTKIKEATVVIENDTLSQTPTERTYKVDMSKYNRDTTKMKAPNFMEPHKGKRLESNYQYEDGKVNGGSTKLKIGKKKSSG